MKVNPQTVAGVVGLLDNGNPDLELAQRAIDLGFDPAVNEAKRILGSTRYDEIDALANADPTYEALQKELGRLSFFFAMPLLNLRLTAKGGFMRSTGLVENQADIMSKSELESYRSTLYSVATNGIAALHSSDSLKPFSTQPANSGVVWSL